MDRLLRRSFTLKGLDAKVYRVLIEGRPCLVLECLEDENTEIYVYTIDLGNFEVREYSKDELFGGYYYIEFSTMIGGYNLRLEDLRLLYEYCYYTSISSHGYPYFSGVALGGDYESKLSLIDYEMYNYILDIVRDAEYLLSRLKYETYTLDNVCTGDVEWANTGDFELYSRVYEDHVNCLDELHGFNLEYEYYYNQVDESVYEAREIKDLGVLAEAIYDISSAYGFSLLSKPFVVSRVLDGLECGGGLFELDGRVWDIVEMYDGLVEYWYDLNDQINGCGSDACIIDYLPGVLPSEIRDYEMYETRGEEVYMLT